MLTLGRFIQRNPISLKQSMRKRMFSTIEEKKCFYLTTPIYYVNGEPHLGHAYTSVLTDVIARFHRKDNHEVFFLTGTDEHGQKVEQSAKCASKPTLEFCSDVSNKFRCLLTSLNCSNDDFIRTTDIKHKDSVKELWKRLEENGQIYLGAYEGWYSVRDECFYAEGDLVSGRAPTGAEVEWVKEASYFFRLSDWTERLLTYYEEHPDFIAPAGRRSEVVSFVEGGLRDLSISRTTFMWGIPVPGDASHVMYVWLDALANYISAIDFPATESDKFRKFWPAGLHVVGKDILRFHAVYWPAFLMAAGLQPPKRIFAHGWWTRDGEKMSKSVGNVVDPQELINLYGVEYVRYFLTAEIRFGSDGDFRHELLGVRINSDLSNNIGNLLQRAMVMMEKHCHSRIPTPATNLREVDKALLLAVHSTLPVLRAHVDRQEMKEMCDAIVMNGYLANKYVQDEAPWNLVKSDDPEDRVRFETVVFVAVEVLRCTAIFLEAIMPFASNSMLDQMGVPENMRSFDSVNGGFLIPGTQIGKPIPVFPQLEFKKNTPEEKPVKIKSKQTPSALDVNLSRSYDSLDEIQLQLKISEVAARIRSLKADTTSAKMSKSEIKGSVDELNYLKGRYICTQRSNGSAVHINQ